MFREGAKDQVGAIAGAIDQRSDISLGISDHALCGHDHLHTRPRYILFDISRIASSALWQAVTLGTLADNEPDAGKLN